MSKLCQAGRHAFADGACTRKGCGATTTGDLFGAPLDASAGPLFGQGEADAAARGIAPEVLALARGGHLLRRADEARRAEVRAEVRASDSRPETFHSDADPGL